MSRRSARAVRKMADRAPTRHINRKKERRLFDDPQFARFKELRRMVAGKKDDPLDFGEEGNE